MTETKKVPLTNLTSDQLDRVLYKFQLSAPPDYDEEGKLGLLRCSKVFTRGIGDYQDDEILAIFNKRGIFVDFESADGSLKAIFFKSELGKTMYPCSVCCQEVTDRNDTSGLGLECNGCGWYFHTSCTNNPIGKDLFNALKDSPNYVKVLCPPCNTVYGSAHMKLKRVEKKVDIMVENIGSVESKITNVSKAPYNTVAAKGIKKDAIIPSRVLDSLKSISRAKEDLDNAERSKRTRVVIKPEDVTIRTSRDIRRAFNKHYSGMVIKHCRLTASGSIMFEFDDEDTAKQVQSTWLTTYFGGNKGMKVPGDFNTTAMVKHVYDDHDKEAMKKDILENYTAVTSCDFQKRRSDQSFNGMIKLEFSSREAMMDVVKNKIRFCNQRYIVEEFKRKSRVIKCSKCQGWGHIHRYCKNPPKCGKCAENHESKSCTITSGFKCAHCKKDHQAGSFDCAVYKEKYLDQPTADHFVNLYSGAPLRGHVPVLMSIQSTPVTHRSVKEQKYKLQSMDWFNWTWDIEANLSTELTDSLNTDDTVKELLEAIENTIRAATRENCPKKCVSKHSKPYWTTELTTLSEKLRADLKSYLARNTDTALAAFQCSKSCFEEARKIACQQFILKKTSNLNTSQANKFWKEFNQLFKPPSNQMVEALISENGSILTENEDIEKEMFSTFFEARNIEANTSRFDDENFNEINDLYNFVKSSNFQPCRETLDQLPQSSLLYCSVTEWEVLSTIKGIKSIAASFDNQDMHQSMLKKLGSNAIYALSKLFTLCLRNGLWLWNESKVIFLKKDGKASYSKAGAYRPISISPYIGKLFERILAQRLEEYLRKVGILDENQEGFTKGKNTIRYLHRLTAGIKGDIRKKLTVLCLFIDFEKAFDSVWKKEATCEEHQQITVFKFADDGTVKVVGKTMEECLFYLNLAMEILGLIVDNKLSYKQHSKSVYNNLVYRWTSLSRYANRNWGMCQAVIVRITKTIMFSTLFYGSTVWMHNSNMDQINKLWYKVSKTAVGAVFNTHGAILEVILGVPPIQTTQKIIAIKHYLKALSDNEDIHCRFIGNQVAEGNPRVLCHLRDVQKFLSWKAENFREEIETGDLAILSQRDIEPLLQLSQKTLRYTKGMIQLFTETLWQDSLNNRLMMEGWSTIPIVSCNTLPIPLGTSREVEVLVMSLMYKNNLLNSFLFDVNRDVWSSPLCPCGIEEQTSVHLLTNCSLVEDSLNVEAKRIMCLCNNLGNVIEPMYDPNCAILNCSRDFNFINLCAEVVKTEDLNLRKRINLPRVNIL
ncbi:hypothetical protein ACHWQZ_G006532 [Mnemiopsis leidyi]